MPGATHITNRLEKPELDDRSYRVIKLANQLEALLVHDPDTDKASASANVNVGNFSDDDSMPGMAHAVEHLLFMGTEKYPIENAYNQYLAAHSGSSNAYTGPIETNYFFEVAATGETKTDAANKMDEKNAQSLSSNDTAASSLYSALDRFAQFFIAPLFLESTLDRELRVVDSENKKNLQSDVWRFMQLNKSLSNPKHPYHHFSTGNLQTLRDDPQKRGVEVRSKFIEFHKQAPLHAFPTNSDVPLSSSGVQTVKEAPLKCEPHVRNGDLVNRPSPNELQHQRRRGRGKRRNDAYWKDYNSTDDTDPFDGRECLFSDGRGSLRVPALANLDTALKVPGGLIMSTRYARELGRYQDISHDFDDPCLRSISGHLTPVTGVLRDVVFRLRGTSCTFKRDFFICDAIDDLVDIMLGASFIKDHFKLLFERVWECMSTFSAWFSTKKETKEEKAERERRERDQKIRAHEREILRLQKEQQKEEAAQRRSRAEGAATQS